MPPTPAPSTVPPAGPDCIPPVRPAAPGAPGTVTVICPTGFTKSSMEGVNPKTPLYARVTYRPL